MITGFTARADGLLYGGTEPVKVYDLYHTPKIVTAQNFRKLLKTCAQVVFILEDGQLAVFIADLRWTEEPPVD